MALFTELRERARGGPSQTPPLLHRIPTEIYTSEERLAREREVFSTRPLALGHASQLPELGDAIAHDWMGLPLVTVRDKAGQIGTFLNVCRHRNTRLLSEVGVTRLRSFLCPYHNWSYGLDGALKGVPRAERFLNLDRSQLNLVPVPTEVRHGMIWILASLEQELDLDSHLAGLSDDFDAFGLADASFFRQSVRRIDCNWKLIQDAFLDGYHVVRLHRDTVGKFFADGLTATEVEGEHVRNAVGRKAILEATESPPSKWQLREQATFSYTVFPNSVFIMHPDYTSHIALYPLSPDETVFVHSMLTPQPAADEKERAHYGRSFDLIDRGVFEAEDITVSVAAQKGMRSGANRALLAGADEVGLMLFHDILNAAIAG